MNALQRILLFFINKKKRTFKVKKKRNKKLGVRCKIYENIFSYIKIN